MDDNTRDVIIFILSFRQLTMFLSMLVGGGTKEIREDLGAKKGFYIWTIFMNILFIPYSIGYWIYRLMIIKIK